jgi:hypothetical protein
MTKRNWIILLIASVLMFGLGLLMMGMLRKPVLPVDDPKAVQEARMKQYAEDSVKFNKIIAAMATERKKIDSLYSLKERGNAYLWKKLQEVLGTIQSMPPDSVNILFARGTENPPCW